MKFTVFELGRYPRYHLDALKPCSTIKRSWGHAGDICLERRIKTGQKGTFLKNNYELHCHLALQDRLGSLCCDPVKSLLKGKMRLLQAVQRQQLSGYFKIFIVKPLGSS